MDHSSMLYQVVQRENKQQQKEDLAILKPAVIEGVFNTPLYLLHFLKSPHISSP